MQPLTLDLELLASIVFNNNRSIIKASVALCYKSFSSFMLCSIGTSTEASAPAVLSLTYM